MTNQGDLLFFQSNNGGNVVIPDNDDVRQTGGFETDFYLSLFGGNEDDDGKPGNVKTWWGNLMETDQAYKFVSRTQNLLLTLPLVSGNLRKIEDAVKLDLKPYVDSGVITELTVSVSITGPRRVKIVINAFADGGKINITFLANWQAMREEFDGS